MVKCVAVNSPDKGETAIAWGVNPRLEWGQRQSPGGGDTMPCEVRMDIRCRPYRGFVHLLICVT